MTYHQERIVILDFGSQYTQLIARRIRECHVYCEIHPFDIPETQLKVLNPSGIILSGGPETVTADATPRAPEIVFNLGCPVLGICYGMQAMAQQLGGRVVACTHREFGYTQAQINDHSTLLRGIEDRIGSQANALLDVWMSHGDYVEEIPPGFSVILSTANTPIAGMADETRQFYGLQFHPEVTHTRQGKRIIERFLYDICHCSSVWTSHQILDQIVLDIQKEVGKSKVLLGLSGGVDSTVLASLLYRAIGDQLICLFIDTGLLLLDDHSYEALNVLAGYVHVPVIRIDASKQFFLALKGVYDPEEKRKVVGKLFIDLFESEARQHSDITFLAQGTIYPDVVESAGTDTQKAQIIKSHHNVGGLPPNMNLKLLEPLRELFKDEVCSLGLELGLPYDLLYKQPFPGPGLAIRILGEVTPEYVDLVRKTNAIFREELCKHKLYDNISQAFTVFLPINSVGVIGDARQYAPVIVLRAVETTDFMTARWAHLPYRVLESVSNRIINEVPGISRVVYDVSSKPPATIEWE